MQPSKERAGSDGDPLDDLDDLLDDDLAGESGRDAVADRDAPETTPSGGGSERGGRPAGRVGIEGRWFSIKSFAVAVIALGLGVFLGGMIPLIGGTIGHAAGVFLGAFLAGLLFSTGRYAETGLAGAGIGGGSALLNVLGIGFLPIGLQYVQEWGVALLAVGGGIGLVVALVGHYFGRDLRAGLTGELPE
ncbi:hypothetical protein [Halorubrum sp. DTA98]|uniref:hypothetical protein n=1 Tax=Halorubrum sp. DTA98 TaxID=3402163 RepID=UPI003AAD3634